LDNSDFNLAALEYKLSYFVAIAESEDGAPAASAVAINAYVAKCGKTNEKL